MDQMEVDEPTSHRSSPSSLPSSSSFGEHTKDVLSQDQRTMLNDGMTFMSLMWQTSIAAAEGDDSKLRTLIKVVLSSLIDVLAEMDLKNSVIPIETVRAMVDKDGLKQWKVAVQNGVKRNDWVDLIRTCVSYYRTVGLRSIVTIAAVTRPNSASTPLHLSKLLNRGAHSK